MSDDFEKMVKEAVEELSENIKEKIRNVAICVEEKPEEKHLGRIGKNRGKNILGLYEGVPKNAWGRGFGNNLPDKITIFKNPIEKISSDIKIRKKLVKNVVRHEIAHHFGFDEEEAQRLEKGDNNY